MEVGANTRRNFTYQEWILQRFCMAIDSRFTPLWISSTICIWLYCTIISDVKSLDGPSGPEKILQIYMPGLKFIYQVRGGLDLIPLLAFCKRRTYSIVLYTTLWKCSACNRCHRKCEVSFDFENTVTRIHEDPRVTKPYSDKQWETLCR
jgi:hypothetical protein